jgi:plastocyanin
MKPSAAALALTATLAATAAIVIPASASSGARIFRAVDAGHSHTVVLKGLRFHPGTIAIRRGDSVTWKWQDGSIQHNVTGTSFKSRTQSHGSYTVRFTRAGVFNYRCTIHASLGMRGKIVVH